MSNPNVHPASTDSGSSTDPTGIDWPVGNPDTTVDDVLPDLDHFTHDDAWRLGSLLVDAGREHGYRLTIAIWIGEQRVFHVGLPGSSAMTDRWVERKAAVVRHFDRSSLAVSDRYVQDWNAFAAAFATPAAEYAPGDGAVPIRVAGTQVGVLSLSGIEPTGDHDVAVWALHEFVRTAREPRS